MDFEKVNLLIKDADNIFITAHKNIDYDALGSILGIYYLSCNYNKNAKIIIDDESESDEILKSINLLKNNENVIISRYDEIKKEINSKSLLIICDTSSEKRVQNDKLLKIKNKIIFDHHSNSDDQIEEISYMYCDEYASSAVEIVLELVEKMNIYIPALAATIMLTGMYVDTSGFLKNTTDKTHHYASMLYKFGVDLRKAREFLKQNFNDYKRREKLICNANINNKIAIVTSEDIFNPIVLAKISDELLIFEGIEASFTIAMVSDDIVGVSARSMGDIDVGNIMTELGGGGHKYEAACQIKGTVSEVEEKINKLLGRQL